MVPDGSGGAILVWRDDRTGPSTAYAQRLVSDGEIAPGWPIDGLPLGPEGHSYVTNVSSDGQGGVVVVWSDGDPSGYVLFAQRVSPDGTVRWGTGVPVATFPSGNAVSVELLDVSGRRVLREERLMEKAGRQIVHVGSASNLSPGVYQVRLRFGPQSLVSRGVITR